MAGYIWVQQDKGQGVQIFRICHKTFYLPLKGINTLSGVVTMFFCLPSEKGSILKGRTLLPLGADAFLLEKTQFKKGMQTGSHKSCFPLKKMAGILPDVTSPLNTENVSHNCSRQNFECFFFFFFFIFFIENYSQHFLGIVCQADDIILRQAYFSMKKKQTKK